MSDLSFGVSEVVPTRTEADAVHQQTLLGIEPVELLPGRIYGIRTIDGFRTIDLTKPEALNAAGLNRRQPVSRYAFHNIQSFVKYVDDIFTANGNDDDGAYKPHPNHALCIADEEALTIRLIFDARPNEWADVYADLKLQISPEAQRWKASSGKYVAQQDFAEFCERNLESFVTPSAATMLEIAQTFQAKTTVDSGFGAKYSNPATLPTGNANGVAFSPSGAAIAVAHTASPFITVYPWSWLGSAIRLSSGSIKLKREEKVEAAAGERADITIPEELRLALPLFKYDATYEVRARLRYRIQDGAVRLSVLLVDPEMAFEHAFAEVVNTVSTALKMPVLFGKI